MEDQKNKPGWRAFGERMLLKVWRSQGGGLYGLGYIVTFVYLEIRLVITEFMDAESLIDFFTDQLFDFVLRFLGESLGNFIQALIWPLILIGEFGFTYGLIFLVVVYALFEYVVRPGVERRFPELTEDQKEE